MKKNPRNRPEPGSGMRIAIIDDEAELRHSLADFLTDLGHAVESHDDAASALEHQLGATADLVLLDICMPRMDGLTFLATARQRWPRLPIVMITGHGTMDLAIEAMRLGATDFLHKPISLTELEASIKRLRKEPDRSRVPTSTPPIDFVGRSAAAASIRQQIAQIANTGLRTLLVSGETGTGKEVVARLLHRMRHGPHAPYVAVNCPALTESLAESELFGHVKGSFTGAAEDRPGAFRLADGGLLLLDEVADLSNAIQAKLLRSLETWRIQPVGAGADRPVDITVVAACNRPPETLVAEGRLRLDLYHRLNGIDIVIPSLHQRMDDLPDLVEHLLTLIAAETGRRPAAILPSAMDQLARHGWPGNVRELRACLHRAIIFAGDDAIAPAHLRFATLDRAPAARPGLPVDRTPAPLPANERDATLAILQACRWNRTQAAQQLGISYDALRRRIRRHALNAD